VSLTLSLTGNTEVEQHMLDCDIFGEEVGQAIASLKWGKVPGLDQISGEMLKCSPQVTLPFLTTMFNAIFTEGQIPDIWSSSVIFPVFKGGCLDDPDSYRGISLISVLCKVFLLIVSNRYAFHNVLSIVPLVGFHCELLFLGYMSFSILS